MRILHYYLGPHRQGGLNRYATDLASAQHKRGHDVFVLYPVGNFFPQKKAFISHGKKDRGIITFKLHGGLPITLLEGVLDPKMILESQKKLPLHEIQRFCNDIQIDLLHIHTWMGFPEELLQEIKRRNIKVIFTTHDYYGLCPKVNFIDYKGLLCQNPCDESCSLCNASAPSENFLRIRNISFLMKIKNILKPLLKLHKKINNHAVAENPVVDEKNYQELFTYYRNLFLACDKIHYNSSVTESVFLKYIPELKGTVIPITHNGISDRRKIRTCKSTQVRIAMFGGEAPHKGLPMLLNVLNRINSCGLKNWTLDIWGTELKQKKGNITWNGYYSSDSEYDILEKVDLLIVPSLCFETFGFIVSEALSAGVPVLCSATVGAQILLSKNMIFQDERELEQKLSEILKNPDILLEESQIINSQKEILTISEHVNAMEFFYNEIMGTL